MKKIIHLSDLHFRLKWEEDQELVLDAFFKDLSKQIERFDSTDVYLIFSGDVVHAGGNSELYEKFFTQFDKEFTRLKIPKGQRICVPGNHDVSQKYIEDNSVEHEGVVSQSLCEKDFNDFISKQPPILFDKFNNYRVFESKFAQYGVTGVTLSGTGWNIDSNIGVFCLNTALCSSGGYKLINDKGRLAIDTRTLQKWLIECKVDTKILVMHHPIDWLTEWSKIELRKILQNNIALCLSGHVHQQLLFHSINNNFPLIECSAPPLLTNKKDNLGYAIISIDEEGVKEIQYRQWTKNNTFLTGVDFSATDNGKVIIKHHETLNKHEVIDSVNKLLTARLDASLTSFSAQPIVWADRGLSKTNLVAKKTEENKIDLADFILHPRSSLIKAPPQFGLTCLAHYMVKEAWKTNSSLWLYLDSEGLKLHTIEKEVQNELKIFGLEMGQVKCIILDSWRVDEKDSIKILDKLSGLYKDLPIIVMESVADSNFLTEARKQAFHREFEVLYLLALPIDQIRKVVSAYNEKRYIGDENSILSKVVSDIEVLNLHRTPLNCLTLLKVSEKYFDETPINRTELIRMILYLLFNMDVIPTYKARPDLKDCEYVLGRFCETILRTGKYYFTREHLLKSLITYCEEQVIDLEVEVVFDVLYLNNIIISRLGQYCFRYSYWVHYFGAQRMLQDKEFASYIFEDLRYTSYPEIMEFYTGIDRSRVDAVEVLIADLKKTSDSVQTKIGLPDELNPFRLLQWRPSDEGIRKMQSELSDGVLNSKLPEAVKDSFADKGHNPIRPFYQDIDAIFKNYSVGLLWQDIKAASRALRNSDYVHPDKKAELLSEIMRGWRQILNVVIALTPILAKQGSVAYDGAAFHLEGDFGDTIEKKVQTILSNLPMNVVQWFEDELFSNKMAQLLFNHLYLEENEIQKHQLILMLTTQRPRGWKQEIEAYITEISKNSYYLYSVYRSLYNEYQYSFATPLMLREIEHLIKMTLAKHTVGGNTPTIKAIEKIPDSLLPKREVQDDDIKSK